MWSWFHILHHRHCSHNLGGEKWREKDLRNRRACRSFQIKVSGRQYARSFEIAHPNDDHIFRDQVPLNFGYALPQLDSNPLMTMVNWKMGMLYSSP